MSARREGSWQQYRGAVEALHLEGGTEPDEPSASTESILPIYQELRLSLQRLAHVEFGFRGDNRWRVVPPSLALLPAKETIAGVVCGARSPQTVELLRRSLDVRIEVAETDGAPDCIIVRSDSQATLAKAALTAGLRIQQSAAETLLAAQGSIRQRQGWTVSELPLTPGWTVHRFSSSQLRWIEVNPGDSTKSRNAGLFRFAMKHQRFYYLVKNGECFRVPVQLGKYAVIRRRGILMYHKTAHILSVVPVCRPPLLVERALVLCSGRLPTLNDRGRLEYLDVPSGVAQLTANVLCQELG
jgi:hypothetical protein